MDRSSPYTVPTESLCGLLSKKNEFGASSIDDRAEL
jgi:hypothetical protein